ncbi:MAG TPA: hypothetical protein VM890_00525, partial [Longimicrobium sp.]|nr:hypothetical protein [Longimicrobium sp.]
MKYLTRRIPLVLVAALAWLGACDSPSDVRAGPPARLDVVSGNGQQGMVGQELAAPLVVRVTDAAGKVVRGQVVNFVVVSGGGSVFAGTAITTHDGVAQERWTLGTTARDTQRVEARAVDPATGAALVFATFTAVGTPAAPASIAALNGDTMVAGAAGSLVEDSFAVVVRDAHGNRVP